MKFKSADSRKFLFVFAVFAMIAAIFVYYLLVYIPERKQEIDKRGLRILDQVGKNLSEKNETYVHSIFFTGNSIETIDTSISSHAFKTELSKQFSHEEMLLDSSTGSNDEQFRKDIVFNSLQVASDTNKFKKKIRIQKGFFQDFLSGKTKLCYKVEIREDKDSLLKPKRKVLFLDFDFISYMNSVVGYRNDFFNSYALIENGKIRYQSDNLLTESKALDTLDKTISKTGKPIAVTMEGQDYYAFIKPFYFGNATVYLCGFIKEENYQQSQYGIEQYTLWNISSILLLVFCTLPLIKFFTITKFERLRYSDGLAMTVAAFLFFTLFSVWSSGVLYWNKKKKESEKEIKAINDSINTRFSAEVKSALTSLLESDNQDFYLDVDLDSSNKKLKTTNTKLNTLMRTKAYNALLYIDSNGVTNRNYYLNLMKARFADVKARNYFRRIHKQNSYYTKEGKSYYMESILSWDKPDIFGVISYKPDSIKENVKVIAIRQYMQSVQDVILPSGYGMCVISSKGEVYFHSQKLRILKENFIEECEEEAVRSIRNCIRQTCDLDSSSIFANFNTLYYGKKIDGYIKKVNVEGLPFYIVTYVSESRISEEVFNIVFCTTLVVVPFLLLLFLTFLLFYFISFRPTLLESDKIDLRWLNINSTNRNSLILLCLYCFSAILLVVIIILLSIYGDYDQLKNLDSNLFLIVWVSYVGFTGMVVLLYFNYLYCNDKKQLRHKTILQHYHNFIRICAVLTIIMLIYASYAHIDVFLPNLLGATLYYSFVIVMIIGYRKWTKTRFNRHQGILTKYRDTSIFAFVLILLIFLFSVLPVLFTFKVFSDYFYRQQMIRSAHSVKNKVQAKLNLFNKRNDSMYVNFSNDVQIKAIAKSNYCGIDTIVKNTKFQPTKANSLIREFSQDSSHFMHHYHRLGIIFSNPVSWQDLKIQKKKINNIKTISVYAILNLEYKSTLQDEIKIASFPDEVQVEISCYLAIICLALFVTYFFVRKTYRKIQFIDYFKNRKHHYDHYFLAKPESDLKHQIKKDDRNILLITVPDSGIVKKVCDIIESWQYQIQEYSDILASFPNENIYVYKSLEEEYVVLFYDYKFRDETPDKFRQKFLQLEKLESCDEIKIIIITHSDPYQQVKTLRNGSNKSATNETPIMERDIDRLIKMLEKFFVITIGLRREVGLLGCKTDEELKGFEELHNFIEKECSLGNFLRYEKDFVWDQIRNKIKQRKNSAGSAIKSAKELVEVYPLFQQEIILMIQDISHNYYFSIWNNLSKEEKYVLYDLAQDYLVNYKNIRLIHILMDKGLIVFDGGLKIFNLSFRNFILTVIDPLEALRIEKELKSFSLWGIIKSLAIILIISVCLFLFFTKADSMVKIIGLISAMLTMIPNLINTLSFATTKKGTDSEK